MDAEFLGLRIIEGPALVVVLGLLASQVSRQVHTLVRHTFYVGEDGVGCPDAARSLLPRAVGCFSGVLAELRTGGHRQSALHLVGRQFRVFAEHQGGDAGDHGRGHGGARHLEVAVVDPVFGVLLAQVRVALHQRDDVRSRRDQVGFDEGVQGGAGGGEGQDVVVAEVLRGTVVGERAHGDDVGGVARHADAHRVGAGVAYAGNHDDAGLPGCHGRQVERVSPVGCVHRRVQRDVEHADVVGVLVLYDPVDPLNHVRVGTHAGLVEHAHGHQIGGWRDASVLFVLPLIGTVAYDARDVSAVAVGVPGRPEQTVWLVQFFREHVIVGQNAVASALWGSAKSAEGGVNPAVEDGHRDVCPQVASLPHLSSPDGLDELHIDALA